MKLPLSIPGMGEKLERQAEKKSHLSKLLPIRQPITTSNRPISGGILVTIRNGSNMAAVAGLMRNMSFSFPKHPYKHRTSRWKGVGSGKKHLEKIAIIDCTLLTPNDQDSQPFLIFSTRRSRLYPRRSLLRFHFGTHRYREIRRQLIVVGCVFYFLE